MNIYNCNIHDCVILIISIKRMYRIRIQGKSIRTVVCNSNNYPLILLGKINDDL